MMKRFITYCLSSIIMIITMGSSLNVTAQVSTEKLDQLFEKYTIVTIDSRAILESSRNNFNFNVQIPKQTRNESWNVEVYNSGLISNNYISQHTSDQGVVTNYGSSAIPTRGEVVGKPSSFVSLTFNDNFIYGYIKDETGYNFIEPLYYFDKSKKGEDLYVIYNSNDLKPEAPHKCGVTDLARHSEKLPKDPKDTGSSRVGECFEVDYAIANDYLMFLEFGSVIATEDHAIGVTNNVQNNYDDEFGDELQLIIVTQYTATSEATDPWTSSTNAGTLLNSFRSWGPTGFAAIHDVGSLWTDRNFNGSTVGIAYLGVVCTGSRYNCLMNFTTNANSKRQMVTHELGHNFNCSHDAGGSPFIMAPAVNGSSQWSSASIISVDNHVATRTCLADCASSSAPPTASFTFDVIEECTPGLVQFTNTTTSSGTVNYEWNFPGGTPSFSTEENPLVTYNNPGVFNVSLTATNTAGSDEDVQNGAIVITASPVPDFSYAIDGTVVSFFNFSTNATSYFWDFGDGSSSTSSDPVHDFLDDGVYIVQLTATSICGDVTIEEVIVIANPPTAGFDADIEEGCAPLTVQFTSNASNNTDDWLWTFEGGDPLVSTEENPIVTFSTAGSFDVTLTVSNETGEDLLAFTDFITVNDIPFAEFSYSIEGDEVTFTNFSVGGDSYLWDFGDGNTSTEENPVHTYEEDGDYTVTLTVTNECGDNVFDSSLSISLLPVASFTTEDETTDCATFEIAFVSTSTNNPDEFEWVFEGGTPATSSEENPSVIYDEAGQYDVTLTVTNVNGTNTLTLPDYVTVLDDPISGFSFTEDGLTVNFEDGSVGATDYLWDFGDGNTSTEINPIHTYEAEGNYTVELIVTNQCGTNTSTQTVNNYTAVAADFTSNISAGCANLVVEYSDQSTSNVTNWLWTFEGGIPATSTEQNPVVTYEVAGQYDVTLTVSHPESSDTELLSNYIAVSDVPIPSFEYFDDILEVDFTNTTVEGTSYEWDFGDGNTSTEESPTHIYAAEGTYEVELTATNDCGTTTISQSITVNSLPTAGLGADTQNGCGPLTVQFSDESSSNVIAWSWTFEGGNPATSTEENPVVEYASPGTYAVQLEVTSAAGTDMILIDDYIEVLAVPTAAIDYDLVGNVITANNVGTGATSFVWSIDGVNYTEEELVYTFPENGTYLVELSSENQCGTDTESIEITINVYPEAELGETQFVTCVGEELQITDNSLNAETKMWTLFGADPDTSDEDSPIVTYEAEGQYTITLTVTNQYGEDTRNFIDVVTVIGLPSATFTGIQTENVVEFSSAASNTSTYLWDFGDGNTSTEENPTHTFTTNGTFEVTLTVSNECGDFEVTETYTIISNSITEAELAEVKIYPNPAQAFLTIEFDNKESDLIQVQVIDVHGKLISKSVFNSSRHTLDVNDLPGGTYLIRLQSDEASYFKKVVVLK